MHKFSEPRTDCRGVEYREYIDSAGQEHHTLELIRLQQQEHFVPQGFFRTMLYIGWGVEYGEYIDTAVPFH